MPILSIPTSGKDGYAQQNVVSADPWATTRSSGTGGGGSYTAAHSAWSVFNGITSGRGSLVTYFNRSFFWFDTSGISVAPSAATLKIYGFSNGTADIIAIRGNQDTLVGANDFGAGVYNCAGQLIASDGAGTGTLASCATNYSSEITTWSTSGYNDITLNSTALSEMASLDDFKIVLMEYDGDYLDIQPSTGTQNISGMYYQNYTGTSRDPYIDYTAGAAGYTHDIIGVASANISSVNGIATANISKVNGV